MKKDMATKILNLLRLEAARWRLSQQSLQLLHVQIMAALWALDEQTWEFGTCLRNREQMKSLWIEMWNAWG